MKIPSHTAEKSGNLFPKFLPGRSHRKPTVSIHNSRQSLPVQKLIIPVSKGLPVSVSVNVKEAGGYITTGRIQNTLFWKIGWNLHMSSHFRNFPIFYYKISMKWLFLFPIYDPAIFDYVVHPELPFLNFPDKLTNTIILRMLKKLFRRRILHDHAIFHKQNPIRYFSGKIHLMGDNDH